VNSRGARRILTRLYRAALEGVDPRAAVARALEDREVAAALRGARAVGVFAVGKAAAGMIRGARGRSGRSLAILPRGFPRPELPGVEILFASHPEPDRSSLAAARRALAFFASFGPDDVILCLVSGGASSLLALPRPGVTLAGKRRAVALLSAGGASILEINRLRTCLSAVKGGGLGRATDARLITLVLSDVPGDRPGVVGSGPTIRGYRGDLVRVVGSNAAGLAAAATEARRRGWVARFARGRLAGQAREAGERLARCARKLRPGEVLLAGGETTVTLPPRHGRGGRSLELALAAALERKAQAGWVLLAAGSDGRDGGSRAAGAFVDGTTLERARRRGLEPERALLRHDTEPFFQGVGDLLVTGPTGTNVADWVFVVNCEW
jgi:hydroxypyruvate reductase